MAAVHGSTWFNWLYLLLEHCRGSSHGWLSEDLLLSVASTHGITPGKNIANDMLAIDRINLIEFQTQAGQALPQLE